MEFAPTLFVILLVFAFPLINLVGLATSAATVMLVTNCAVATAASQATYTDALQSVTSSENSFLQSGFAKFANIISTGGYQNCGIDLYTQVSRYGASTPSLVGPNTPVPPPISVTNQMYEYAAMGHFQIAPLISMSGIPLVNQIPGLGQPLPMNFRAVKMVEHPQGLSFNAPNSGSYSGQLPQLPRTPIITVNQTSSSSAPASNAPIWRTPNIYNQIAAAGETVVSTTVFSVNAALDWQAPGLTILPGEQVWLDTNAVGSWQAGNFTSDANGITSSSTGPTGAPIGSGDASSLTSEKFYSKFPTNALIGYVGTPPTPMLKPAANQSDPNAFLVGNTLSNYPLPTTGPLSFMSNFDWHTSGNISGIQLVRIIIVR